MEKAGEIDFKTGEDVPTETGQTEETSVQEEIQPQETQEPIADEVQEDVESLPSWAKDRLTKAEQERENLSLAVKRLNKERKLTPDKPKEETLEEEIYPEWDETSKKFQKQTISQAEKIAKETIEKANEKAAIAKFVAENADVIWDEVVANYIPTHGKETVEDILKDLNRAKVLTRYEKGELTNLEQEALKKGEKKGKAEANLADLASVSKTTSKTVKGTPNLSQGALKLAEQMKVNPEKLAAEDDSLTAEIKF